MAELIIMPKLGFNMSVGKLVKWYKSEGQEIKKGEALFSVETDKTNMDIEATGDGFVLKLLINEGDTVDVTLPIAIVGEKDENIESIAADALARLGRKGDFEPCTGESLNERAKTAIDGEIIPALCKNEDEEKIKITPRARKAAKERNIDISCLNIEGTGYRGGICEADILKFADSNKVRISPLAEKMAKAEEVDVLTLTGSGAGGKIMKRDVESAVLSKRAEAFVQIQENEKESSFAEDGKEILEVVPYAGVRRIIGERMCQSKFTAPHLYFTKAVDLTNVLDLRRQVNAAQPHKTSVTDFISAAVVKALQKYPDINSSLAGEQIVKYKTINLGIAVAAPGGLIVPNVKDAEKKDLITISKESSELFAKAREGKLAPSEYTGGTFTISNLGMFGIDNFTAIINQPESAILAVSATEKRPVVISDDKGEDMIVVRPMMNITLTVDHRLIDGLLAAQFVGEVKKYLENPITLLLNV